MPHDTLTKFGAPDNVIREYKYWSVLLRPKQVTLGSLVMICNEDATSFSEISTEAFEEQQEVIKDIEQVLGALFEFEKINYLMLMMVDPHVHYHVIPRYDQVRKFEEKLFSDTGWPALPDLAHSHDIDSSVFISLRDTLIASWPEDTDQQDVSATA